MRSVVSNGRQWTTTGPRGPTDRRPRPRRRSPRRAGPRRSPPRRPPTSIRRSPRAESMSATYNAWQQPPQSARNPMPSVTIRGGFLRQQKTNEQNDRVLLHFVKPFILFPWHRVWHFRPRSFFWGITPTTAPGAGRRGRRPLPRPTPHTHGRARRPRRAAPTGRHREHSMDYFMSTTTLKKLKSSSLSKISVQLGSERWTFPNFR